MAARTLHAPVKPGDRFGLLEVVREAVPSINLAGKLFLPVGTRLRAVQV